MRVRVRVCVRVTIVALEEGQVTGQKAAESDVEDDTNEWLRQANGTHKTLLLCSLDGMID